MEFQAKKRPLPNRRGEAGFWSDVSVYTPCDLVITYSVLPRWW